MRFSVLHRKCSRLDPRPYRSRWGVAFKYIDTFLRVTEPVFSKIARGKAIAKAVAFVDERLNGEDGLGAIYPAMAYALMMYDVLGYPRNDPRCITIWKAIDKLLVENEDEIYCPALCVASLGHQPVRPCNDRGMPEWRRRRPEGLGRCL